MIASPSRLVVAHNFAPYTDGSAVTVAKRILGWDEVVDVVSMDMRGYRTRDDSLYEVVKKRIAGHLIVNGQVAFTRWSGPRSFMAGAYSWVIERSPYAHVYSRAMWPHSHFLGALVRGEGRADTWSAEFSDPLLWTTDHRLRISEDVPDDPWARRLLLTMPISIQDEFIRNRSILYWAQMLPFVLADELIFTNDQQLEVMIQDAPPRIRGSVRERATVSPHPVAPRELFKKPAQRARDGLVRLGYFGTFYGNRGLSDLLEAMSTLSDHDLGCLRLDVFGSGSAGTSSLGRVGSAVAMHAPLPYMEFLNRMSAYDYLLVNDVVSSQFPVVNPYLPSKVSDYLGSGVPVLALVVPGSPLDELDLPWRASRGDIRGIRELLLRAINEVEGA